MKPSRREALLATGAVILWPAAASARASARRLRAGAPLSLGCPGAEAFRLEALELAPRIVPAPGGRVTVPAPLLPHADGLAELRCTPLRGGRPCGAPVVVAVLAPTPGFGG